MFMNKNCHIVWIKCGLVLILEIFFKVSAVMIECLSILIILDDHTTALVNYTNNAKCIGFSKEIFQNLPKQLQLVSGVCYRII